LNWLASCARVFFFPASAAARTRAVRRAAAGIKSVEHVAASLSFIVVLAMPSKSAPSSKSLTHVWFSTWTWIFDMSPSPRVFSTYAKAASSALGSTATKRRMAASYLERGELVG